MSLGTFLYEHFHSGIASTIGGAASILAPLPDMLQRIVVGVATGVLVWCVTKTISFLVSKLGGKVDP